MYMMAMPARKPKPPTTSSIGLLPGEQVRVLALEPSGGPLLVEAGGARCAISRDLAALIGIG
jgi:Fe2+ transport system protein FeoA